MAPHNDAQQQQENARFVKAVENLMDTAQSLIGAIPQATRVAELETKMEYLYGNGKPGAVASMMKDMTNMRRMLYIAYGGLLLLGAELGIAVPLILSHIWK